MGEGTLVVVKVVYGVCQVLTYRDGVAARSHNLVSHRLEGATTNMCNYDSRPSVFMLSGKIFIRTVLTHIYEA